MIELKKFRNKKKMNQKDVADAIGVDQSRISKYENGKEVTPYMTSLLIDKYPDITEFIVDMVSEPVISTSNELATSYNSRTDIEKQLASIMFRLQAVEAYIAEQLSLVKNEE